MLSIAFLISALNELVPTPGGRIDHAHHKNNAFRANTDTLALSKAVAKADTMTSPDDTLLVVTADHSHVYTLGGYPDINEDLYGRIEGLKTPFISDMNSFLLELFSEVINK